MTLVVCRISTQTGSKWLLAGKFGQTAICWFHWEWVQNTDFKNWNNGIWRHLTDFIKLTNLIKCLIPYCQLWHQKLFPVCRQDMAQPVPDNINFPDEEEKVLNLWKELKAFETSLEQSKKKPKYVTLTGGGYSWFSRC